MIIRKILKYTHLFAATAAMICDLGFMVATVYAELSFDTGMVQRVKAGLVQGLWFLLPALMLTGLTGMGLSGFRPKGPAGVKLKRLQIIAANGFLVLLPSVLFLNTKAQALQFDAWFWAVQTVELGMGGVNIALMALNMRDGLRMSGRLVRPSRA